MQEFKVGDEVAVINRDRIAHGAVAGVRRYKVRTKVTLVNGSEWDANGKPWAAGAYPTGHIEHMSDDLRSRLRDQARRRACQWAAENWFKMPEDVRQTIGDALVNACRAYRRKP